MHLITSITLMTSLRTFEGDSYVKTVKPAEIYNLSRDVSDNLQLIQYYSGEDQNAENYSKILEATSRSMSGYVKVGAINLDKHPLASYVNRFTSLPTYAFYGYYKSFPEYFDRFSNVDEIHEEASKQISYIFDERVIMRYVDVHENYELGYVDVEMKLNNSREAWAVVYYDSECQKSKDFSVTWIKLVEELNQQFRFGSINNHIYKFIETNTHPVIKFFPKGNKFLHEPVTYEGISLEYEHVYNFFYDQIPTPKLSQIVNVNNVTPCFKRNFCVGVFMPKIIDCDGNCRSNSLQVLRQACEKFKQYSFYCAWSEFDEQPELQRLFHVKSSSNPVVVILHVKSEYYKKVGLDLSLDKLDEVFDSIKIFEGFDEELIIKDIPGITTVKAWSFEESSNNIKTEL